jgi:hypothetical protein
MHFDPDTAARPLSRLERVFAVLLVALSGCVGSDSARPSAGSSPATIRVTSLDGHEVDVWDESNRAATVFVFTRTDCPIANRYAPEIQKLYERYRSRDVKIALVYVDPRESPDSIRQHMKEFAYTCPAFRDPQHKLAAHCGATITPEAVVFDKNRSLTYLGRIDDRFVEIGQSRSEPTTHDLDDAIESTILGKPVRQPRTRAVGCLIADLKP